MSKQDAYLWDLILVECEKLKEKGVDLSRIRIACSGDPDSYKNKIKK